VDYPKLTFHRIVAAFGLLRQIVVACLLFVVLLFLLLGVCMVTFPRFRASLLEWFPR
jgi:hypothetical protein